MFGLTTREISGQKGVCSSARDSLTLAPPPPLTRLFSLFALRLRPRASIGTFLHRLSSRLRVCSNLGLNHGTVLPKSVVHEGRTRSSSKLLWVSTLVLFAAACGGGGGGSGGIATETGGGGTTTTTTTITPPPPPDILPLCTYDEFFTCDETQERFPNAVFDTSSFGSWNCVEDQCPISAYEIVLTHSIHGIARFADFFNTSDTHLGAISYGMGSVGKRPLDGPAPTFDETSKILDGVTFIYTGEAIGYNPSPSSGSTIREGNVRINIRGGTPGDSTGDPIDITLQLQGLPQWSWRHSDDPARIRVTNTFIYEEQEGPPSNRVNVSPRNRITGRYYGPNHEEFGGTFLRDGWQGAYGAEKIQ